MNHSLLLTLALSGFMLIAVRETAICQDMEKMHTDLMKDFDQVAVSSEAIEKESTPEKPLAQDEKGCKQAKDKCVQNDTSTPKEVSQNNSEVKTNP